MRYDDFCRLTRVEFEAAYRAYYEREDARYRDEWQRMRLLATILVQPHTHKKITPQGLLPFPWDKAQHRRDHPAVSEEEDKKRLESLLQRIKRR